jgi:hypothetical protein
LPAGFSTVKNALLLPCPAALFTIWYALGVTGKSVEYVTPVTKIWPATGSNASPVPTSAVPEPPSKVENGNWLAPAVACVVSTADANAVIGTLTVGIPSGFDAAGSNGAKSAKVSGNGRPELLFVARQALEVVGKIPPA